MLVALSKKQIITPKLQKLKINLIIIIITNILILVENELKKMKAFDLSYFIGKSHFEENGAQDYLVFQSIHRHFKITNKKYISSWKSKGLTI